MEKTTENTNNEGVELTVIEKALVKENITAKVIAAMKEKYGNVKISGIDDVETIQLAEEGKKELSNLRNLAIKICKAGRENAIKEQKDWIAKEKDVTKDILAIEEPIKAELKRIEDEKERALHEHAQRGKLPIRQARLQTIGVCVPDEELLKLNDVDFISLFNDLQGKQLAEREAKILEQEEKIRVEREATEKVERERLNIREKDRRAQLAHYSDITPVPNDIRTISDESYLELLTLLQEKRKNLEIEAEEKRKRELEEAAAKARKAARAEQLRPYIMFIRDYSSIIELSDEEYQKEFAKIHQGAIEHYQHEAKEKAEREAAEQIQKEKEAREKAEREALIAGRVTKLASIGVYSKEGGWYADVNGDVGCNHIAVENWSDEQFEKELLQFQNTMSEAKFIRQRDTEFEQKALAELSEESQRQAELAMDDKDKFARCIMQVREALDDREFKSAKYRVLFTNMKNDIENAITNNLKYE
jgi:hypothetical protein